VYDKKMSDSSKPSDLEIPTQAKKTQRWYWLDWLRVLAMGMIFLFHSGRPFVPFKWHIMNPEPDLLFTLFNIFVTGWIMPLFFVISGIATYFSLAKRSPGKYVTERFKRLLIPFIFGLIVILPIHRYYSALFQELFTGSFIGYYFWEYFTIDFPFTTYFSSTYFAGSNQGTYLWYIFWLFLFSLITVHFFKWLRKEENRNKISTLATICNRRGGIFLLAIPLIIVDIVSIPPYFVFPSGYGGWKLSTYLVFFILAYILASNTKFEQSIDKNRITTLVIGIITTILIIIFASIIGAETISEQAGIVSYYYILFTTLWSLNGWCWVMAIIGFGRRLLNFNHKYLKPSNELVLPFYILHETVIVAVAFYVVNLNLIVILKFLIIVLASFTIISLLLLPIKHIKILRFLFGMNPK
jgi:surface polysaccharide O-acyltransferase-like enzyme